ncbi:MAG: dihydrofolate reductase [Xanthobacteraceae bacterium]|nr:MAG: dihydrofolate reductase [Xanthobacteraceae bacterium]
MSEPAFSAAPAEPELVFLVAVADNGVIGAGNTMPWHLRSDLQRFKRMTMGKPVVMGRKTFQSIGRPLPGRTNIVLTRDVAFRAPGVVAATSPVLALELARADALRRFAAEIVVIGGAEIFAQWMDRASRLEITEVHAWPAGDTFFPPFSAAEWRQSARERHAAGTGDSANFSYVTYRRASAA